MVWDTWHNAERYEQFVTERGVYRWLNARLAERAGIESARRILDLGCGTGATARACLPRMSPDAELVGVDASAEMVEVARANVPDPRARFDVLPAGRIAALDGSFDRVLSNAAVWQFPRLAPVFEGVARLTDRDALFCFNVPAERIDGERTPIHPFQAALMREIDSATGGGPELVPDRIDAAGLAELAERHDFDLDPAERLEYEATQDELIELMSLPAMIEPLTPGLDEAERDEVLRRARERSDPQERVAVPWIFFRLTRRPG